MHRVVVLLLLLLIGGCSPAAQMLHQVQVTGVSYDTVKDPKIPLLIFDKDNADTAGKPPKVNTGYGDAYVDGYRQLWKLH